MKPNNLVEMLYHTVERFPSKVALMWKVDGKYVKMTYEQLWNKIRHIAAGFAQLGIKENDKIAILSNSNPFWAMTDFAAASLGAVSVPIYPTLPEEQVTYVLKNAEVCMAIVEDEQQLDKLNRSEGVHQRIVMKPSSNFTTSEGVFTFSEVELLGMQHRLLDWEDTWKKIDHEQLLTIIHTSGTTGNPKGVMLSHGNLLSNIDAVQFWIFELYPDDIALSYLPLSHVFERMAGHYLQFSVGTTVAYAESIETIQENLKEIRPTIMTTVPRLLEKVYAKILADIKNGSAMKRKIFNWAIATGVERYEHYANTPINELLFKDSMPKNLRRKWNLADRLVYQKVKSQLGGRLRGLVSGGATLNPKISKFFWAMDVPIFEGYGLTETAPVITTNPMIQTRIGTVGKVLPNLEVRIAEDGEVLVRGPSVMKGYYNDPIATNEAFDDDWFFTGDIGKLDTDNYLKIIDRKKRILVLSTGKNVAPQPLESAINESMYIQQSAVLGDNQKYVICLVNPDVENLIGWLKQNDIHSENYSEACRHPKVQALIENEVERYTRKFARFEKPKKIVIIDDEWTVDSGELTPKLSLRMNVIEEKYKTLIEETYREENVDYFEEETIA